MAVARRPARRRLDATSAGRPDSADYRAGDRFGTSSGEDLPLGVTGVGLTIQEPPEGGVVALDPATGNPVLQARPTGLSAF